MTSKPQRTNDQIVDTVERLLDIANHAVKKGDFATAEIAMRQVKVELCDLPLKKGGSAPPIIALPDRSQETL